MITNKFTANFRPLSPGQIYDQILYERKLYQAKNITLTAHQLARLRAKTIGHVR
jgi:hypothetical protein